MTGLEPFFLAASAVGTGMSFVGGMNQASAIKRAGINKQKELEYRAKQNEALAIQDVASSQRDFIGEQRKKRLAQSRAIAVAGQDGGGLDSSFAGIMEALSSEGQYRQDLALYQGRESALNREQQADILRYEGENAKIAAASQAKAKKFSTVANTVTSLGSSGMDYSKYKKGKE